jgi:hypothetical protein
MVSQASYFFKRFTTSILSKTIRTPELVPHYIYSIETYRNIHDLIGLKINLNMVELGHEWYLEMDAWTTDCTYD